MRKRRDCGYCGVGGGGGGLGVEVGYVGVKGIHKK